MPLLFLLLFLSDEKSNQLRVPLRYLPKSFSKPLDVQDYILAIHFKFEIKIPLNQLREEPVVAFFLPPFSTILGLNEINMR